MKPEKLDLPLNLTKREAAIIYTRDKAWATIFRDERLRCLDHAKDAIKQARQFPGKEFADGFSLAAQQIASAIHRGAYALPRKGRPR